MKEKVDFKAYQAKLASREAFEAAWLLPDGAEIGGLTIETRVPESKHAGRTIWFSDKTVAVDPMWKRSQ